jgi:hypothetical protein
MHPIRTIVGACLLLLASFVSASAQTTVFVENCTVSTDTALTAHTPNIGSSWTAFEDTTAGVAVPKCDNNGTPSLDDSINASASTVASSRVLIQANPSTPLTNADYYIEVSKISEPGSADDLAFVFARATDNSNYYGFGFYRALDNPDCFIFEVVADVYTQLDSGNCGFAVGSTARFDLTGTTLSVSIDGVATVLSVSDSTFTAAGTAGIGFGNIRTATDDVDTNWRLDGFTIVQAAVVASGTDRYVCAAANSSCGGTPAYATVNAAIDAASAGDTIYLKASESFGSFILDNKGACTAETARITIRSSTADALLPPANQRINPTYSDLLPFIQSPDSDNAVDSEEGACGYTLQFLEFGSNLNGLNTVIQLGSNATSQQQLADQVSYITVDRVYINGDAFLGGRHGIEMNGAHLSLINSYCDDMKTFGADSQCVTAFNGSGPLLIENNYLEGSTENILFGGAVPEMRSCAFIKASPAPTTTVFELENFRGTQDNGCDVTETAASEPDHSIADLAVGQRLCVQVSAALTDPVECITVQSKASNVVTLSSALSGAPAAGRGVWWGTELADVVVRRNHLYKPNNLFEPIISAATNVAATLDTTTGTLTAGTYYYKVVCFATGNEGQTINSPSSAEVSYTLEATGSIKVSWSYPTNATSCRVYGRSSGTSGATMYWSVSSPTAVYVDTGSAGTTGAIPSIKYWSVKNIFEIKYCRDCIVEYNVFENHRQGSTTVPAIVIKTSNTTGTSPRALWVNGDNLTFRYNVTRKVQGCYSISGYQHGGDVRNRPQPASGLLWHDNLCYDAGSQYNLAFNATPASQDQFQVFDALNNWTIRNNTTIMDQRAVITFENANPFGTNAFRDNIAFKGSLGIRGNDQQGEGVVACTFYSGTTCTNNVIGGGQASIYSGNLTPTRTALQAAFVNFGGLSIGDYALTTGHAYRTAGTGGGMIGADVEAIVTGTAGVVTGTPTEFPIFSTLDLPDGTEQAAYSAQIQVTGGTGAKTCATTAGTVPTGTTLSSACLLSGTPTTAGDYTFTVTATDTVSAAASRSYTVTIEAAAISAVVITTTDADLPDATTAEAYAQTLNATGGLLAYSWSIVSGAGNLPPGWVLSPTQGTITGTATTTGIFSFTVRVSSGALTDTETYSITVSPGTPPPAPSGDPKRARKWNGQELFTFVREDCTLLTNDDRVKVGDICVDFYNRIWVSTATSPSVTMREAKLPPELLTVTVDGATTFAVTSSDYIVLTCTGAETINTITGGVVGKVLVIENTDTDCTIADDDAATAADAVDLTGTATNDVGAAAKVIGLIYNGTHWKQIWESDN